MGQIISFYSTTANQGKRTLSLAFSKVLAANNFKVLYVEMDYIHPSFAYSTRISNPIKNFKEYTQKAVLEGKFDPEPYILTNDVLQKSLDKKLHSNLNDIPRSLDFLTIPLDFEESNFPTIVREDDKEAEERGYDFVTKMLFKMQGLNYDYIVFNLPNEIRSVFGLPMLINSDKVMNVITPNPSRIQEYQSILKQIKQATISFDESWHTIINQASPSIDENEFEKLLTEDNPPFVIPFDTERVTNELALKIGSNILFEYLERFISSVGIDISPTPKKSRSFLRR